MRRYTWVLGLFVLVFVSLCDAASAAETVKKIGVVASEASEEYANIIRPGGTYQGQRVVPKEDFSSIKDKRLKTKVILERSGYAVEYINDSGLANLSALQQYDVVVFPNTVLMNKEQRLAVKEYIKQGGGAIFAYATARNESAVFPKEGEMDITALIYHTGTWVYEWDNLSEVFQSRFVNDVVLKNYEVSSVGQHPIIKNTLAKLGKNHITISHDHSYGEWIEVIEPYPNSNVTPLMEYSNWGYNSSPVHTPPNTGASYAIEYGKGKVVYFGFQLLNFIEGDGNEPWEDPQRGAAWGGLSGGYELETLLNESVKWTSTANIESKSIDRSVDIELTDVSAYARANDYVIYATMTSKSVGNMINRGTMTVEVVSPSGNVLTSYEKQVIGLTPKGSSYPEKVQLTIPKNPANGHYYLRAKFHSGVTKGSGAKIAGDIKRIQIQNNVTKHIGSFYYNDVPGSYWAADDIYSLAGSGIISHTYGSHFMPNVPITRLDAAAMIVNTLGLSVQNRPNPGMTDVKPGQKGYEVIAAVVDEGIFSGSNGRFNPNNPLTREQMSKILVNAFNLSGRESNNFSDVIKGGWSEPYIETLLFNKVTNVQGQYRPLEKTTRAQFASFLRRSATIFEN